MKAVTREMLKIYKPYSSLDWMNYKIVRKEDLTFHHIQKREDSGKETIENGCLLLKHSHQYLHLIECKDIRTYDAINKIFKYINQQRHEPTREQREIIEFMLREFEVMFKNKKNSKGDSLIKRKYLKREIDVL